MSQTQQLATAKQAITKCFDAVAHMVSGALQYVRQSQSVSTTLDESPNKIIKDGRDQDKLIDVCKKKMFGFKLVSVLCVDYLIFRLCFKFVCMYHGAYRVP